MNMPPHGQEPPELTSEDLRKIEKSMRRPEFMGLLSEYMVEISDPKNKQEYDDWLRQMQKENELPKHMKLIQPCAEFCVKTSLNSIKNKQHEMKFFINICSSIDIEKPSFEAMTNDRGETGQNWKIPNSMGKIRYDQDKKGAVCNTVDAVFHPDVFVLAQNKAFQSMVINIALDTATKQLGERKETLSKDYVVMQNIKCKGGEPALLPVRSIDGRLMNKGDGEERDRDGRETKLQKEINDKKQVYDKEKMDKIKEKEKEEQEMKKLEKELQQENNGALESADDSQGPTRPKYHTVYTYSLDYGDYLQGNVNQKKKKKRPTHFAIEFELPRIENFSDIKALDVSENKLVLDAGQKYFIDLDFSELKISFKLISSESKAKFDKKKRTLRISFPIDKNSLKEEEEKVEQKQQEIEENQPTVEDQTWKDKSKLLEISDNSVSLQFIKPEENKTQQKVFVQEIDEDDIKDNPPQQKAEQIVPLVPTPTQTLTPTSTSKPLTYKFQQTEKNAFIIAHLPKYKKEDLLAYIIDNNIVVKWTKEPYPQYFLLTLTKTEYTNVNISFVVDYVVFRVDKKGFWEKQSIVESTATKEEVESICEELLEKKRKQLEEIRTVAVRDKEAKQEAAAKSSLISKDPHEEQVRQQKIQPSSQPQPRSFPQSTTNPESARQAILDSRPKQKNIQFIKFNIDLLSALD